MTTNFPTSIDALVNPTATDSLATVNHADQHANANDAIEAIETQIGTTSAPVLARLASPTFTGTVRAKTISDTYPRVQFSDSGKMWSQPSNFPPYLGRHNDQYVGYGSDTQVYIERSEPTAHILTVKMNRFQAIASEQAQVTSGSFPASGSTITLADASAFPNSANSGTLFYEQISDDLTTAGSLSASWTDRTPYGSPLSRFTVTSTGAYCTFADGPSIATVSTGELNHEVTCRFSGTLQNVMGIVVRYNDLGSGSASWISLRYNSTYAQIDVYGFFRSTGGTVTGTYIGQTETFGFVSGMYVKAVVDSDRLAVYTGVVNDQNEIEYSTPRTFTLTDSNLLLGTNAGLVQHGTTVSTTERYTNFSVQAKKSFTYTGKSGSSLTGVTCATAKTFTADASTFATYTDISPINLITAVDSIGAVIWRLKNMGGQHTTDNITMGGNDDGGEIGLAFQSDINRNESGLVFFGDSAPSGTPNASGNRGTFLRRVGARLIRSGGRLHIAPSDITNYAGTATGDGTPAAPHLSIGNIDTGLYLTTSGTDTLRVSVDGTNVASFASTGITSSFVGNLTGNASGSAATVTGAAQSAITSVGTLTGINLAGNINIGTTTLRSVGGSFQTALSNQIFQEQGSGGLNGYTSVINRPNSDALRFIFGKSRGSTVGSVTALVSGDHIAQIMFAGADGTTVDPVAAQIQASVDGAVSTGIVPGRLVLYTGSTAGVSTERMRIDSNGNVGIGTTTQTTRLEVTGNATVSSQNNVAAAFGTTTSGRLLIGSVTGNTPFIGSEGATTLAFNTNATVRMRITSDGNVGIAVGAPTSKLHISGSFSRGAPVTKTANFTLADTENWIICNGTATITATLPAASTQVGREISLKNIAAFTVVSASSNIVPLAGGAAGTAILPATAGAWAKLVSDGTSWVIMQS